MCVYHRRPVIYNEAYKDGLFLPHFFKLHTLYRQFAYGGLRIGRSGFAYP